MKDIETINPVNRDLNPIDHELVRTFYGCFSDISNLQNEVKPARPLQLPAINIQETANAYYFDMALPGYHKKDLQLEMEGDVLTVHANMRLADSKNVMRFYRHEFETGDFTRSFLLPEDAGTPIASFSNGVLHIRLQKEHIRLQKETTVQGQPEHPLKIPIPIQ